MSHFQQFMDPHCTEVLRTEGYGRSLVSRHANVLTSNPDAARTSAVDAASCSRSPDRRVAISGLCVGFGALMQTCATSRSEPGNTSIICTSQSDAKSKGNKMLTLRGIAGPQGQLAVDDAGSGRLPVLFVHADGGNFTQWREALDHLRPRRRAIAFDLRGHGRSARPADGDQSVGGRCADIGAVVDALGLERFLLVGHSGGGVVVLQYAAQQAAKVAGLLLVDPATDGRQFPVEKRKQFMQLLHSSQYAKTADDYYTSIAGTNSAVIERVLWDLHATPHETVIGTFEALAAYDPVPALQAYGGPRLMLVTPASDTHASIRRLDTSVPHRTVECTGHWVNSTNPPHSTRSWTSSSVV